ncbi:MAG: hypothetical protein JRH16_07635 [Deltaproteobacteria bacterium]|nr:hypothetical protein [Deltaproteobacteria bacterium]MBW2361860.1 hypothetical protein [Deltaproteobacteria bacterium]
MAPPNSAHPPLLERCLTSGRLHSAYLLAGPGTAPREAALAFVRACVCTGPAPGPCEACRECRRSGARDEIPLDGSGKSGPLLRHIGDHPDLLWIERGATDTRVRIAQIRQLQQSLRLRGEGEGRRAAVVADAEWLNPEAQNALLRVLEEPPPRTTLVLVATSSASLLATVRSRCQRVVFPPEPDTTLTDPENAEIVSRFDDLRGAPLPRLLSWAQEYRGARAPAAAAVHTLLDTGAAWLRARVAAEARAQRDVRRALDADRELSACRKVLDRRNANPQMVAERALLALHGAAQ